MSQATFSWTGRSSFFTKAMIRRAAAAGPLERPSIGPAVKLRLDGLVLFLGLSHDPLGQVPRDLLVARQLHRVLAPPRRDRAQVRRVAQHLSHRYLCPDLGARALRLH